MAQLFKTSSSSLARASTLITRPLSLRRCASIPLSTASPSILSSYRLCSHLSKSPAAPHSPAPSISSKSPVVSTQKAITNPRNLSSSANMANEASDTYAVAFESNSKWRRSLADSHPELFAKLGKGQAPQILWIGCADSRCPETTILGLQPGDIFCHRNIANILVPTDLSSLAVIQYAVQYLKVKHIIVCGHTSCGGVAAALDNKKLGLIDTWLMPLRHLRQKNIKLLEMLSPHDAGLKLVELNVRNSVNVLQENPIVLEAMAERDLKVHGVIYDVGSGELNELDISETEDEVSERKKAFVTS